MNGPFPWDILALASLLLANRTVVRSIKPEWGFWAFQALNLAGAVWFAVEGIQGLDNYPIANWIVCGLLVFHAIQNYVVRQGGKRI